MFDTFVFKLSQATKSHGTVEIKSANYSIYIFYVAFLYWVLFFHELSILFKIFLGHQFLYSLNNWYPLVTSIVLTSNEVLGAKALGPAHKVKAHIWACVFIPGPTSIPSSSGFCICVLLGWICGWGFLNKVYMWILFRGAAQWKR